MARIRLVGLDLDGTLLTDKKTISPATLEALSRAHAQGVYLVPVTGRPYKGIPKNVRDLPYMRYMISCNGASIRDSHQETILQASLIEADTAKKLVALLHRYHLPFEVLLDGVGYAEPWVYESLIAKSPEGSFLRNYVRDTRETVPDILAFVEKARGLEEIFVIAGATQETLLAELSALPPLQIVHPAVGALEITAEGVDKGKALLALAEHLRLSQAETMAIGDSGNDVAMLRQAGHAVAMGNAPQSVKDLAHSITDTNEQDGVAKALLQFVLDT